MPVTELGKVIRAKREARSLSQAELAKVAKVNRGSVELAESAPAMVSLMQIVKIARALDLHVEVELLETK